MKMTTKRRVWRNLNYFCKRKEREERVKIRRIVKLVGAMKGTVGRRTKGEKLLEAHLDRHHLLISLNRHRFFCRLIFRILLNYNETLWGLAEKPDRGWEWNKRGRGIYVNRWLMSSGIIPREEGRTMNRCTRARIAWIFIRAQTNRYVTAVLKNRVFFLSPGIQIPPFFFPNHVQFKKKPTKRTKTISIPSSSLISIQSGSITRKFLPLFAIHLHYNRKRN